MEAEEAAGPRLTDLASAEVTRGHPRKDIVTLPGPDCPGPLIISHLVPGAQAALSPVGRGGCLEDLTETQTAR